MCCKVEARADFSLLFKIDGVPSDMVSDGSKEQTLGHSKRKCRESDFLLNHIDPN